MTTALTNRQLLLLLEHLNSNRSLLLELIVRIQSLEQEVHAVLPQIKPPSQSAD